MFIDEVYLDIESGKGGDGIVSFRREKYIPFGGPSGGDGGKGGSVIFEANEGLSTLYDLKYQHLIRAKAGENGKIKNMHGKDSDDVIVKVPVGTMIYERVSNKLLADLTKDKEQAVICKGGKGGRGNAHFATSRNQAPRFQENGEPGEVKSLRIELKLLADVGIIGFPSVGKSTLISAVTGSKPKIADYPFTTIIPNLGVVDEPGIPPFVLADMPGLIAGASSGAGLGIQFLKHIERTRVLIHMVDMSDLSGRDPYEDYLVIMNELASYRHNLSKRPQILVASKMDADGAVERLASFKKSLDDNIYVYPISTIKRVGLREVLWKAHELLESTPFFPVEDNDAGKEEEAVYYGFNPEEPEIIVKKENEDLYVVSGKDIERLYNRATFQSDESLSRFLSALRKIGIDDYLRKAGAKNGDTIRIGEFEFEFLDQ
ncbi:MAG TPA: GTPase ObgE [Bacillota bacterium]|nr:GTPase ObgE [Bacillota bacterium]HPF42664.1 GTPase ObgE [Bacillota bacterium]HPJ85430.1 GTPase ObgE [Bacillota bacterium]HPQ61274.1 GTPase ObgE [Bacillota bacterium]